MPDPIYENLYDRFYAMMQDMAVTEHLSFAYAYSGEDKYFEGVLLALGMLPHLEKGSRRTARRWQSVRGDANTQGDGAGLRCALRSTLPRGARRGCRVIADIAQRYYGDYFTQSSIAGSGFHTHHAIVEWSSFGVAARAVLGEVAHAQMWVEATVTKFQKHLLPMGLAADGAQVEGMTTFWASTMHSRLFFMDALCRVTGKNLFADYAKYMDDRVVLATVAGPAPRGLYSEDNQSVIFSPSYAQLDYYSAALLYLAREYRRPLCQRLARWDTRMGAIQTARDTSRPTLAR